MLLGHSMLIVGVALADNYYMVTIGIFTTSASLLRAIVLSWRFLTTSSRQSFNKRNTSMAYKTKNTNYAEIKKKMVTTENKMLSSFKILKLRPNNLITLSYQL